MLPAGGEDRPRGERRFQDGGQFLGKFRAGEFFPLPDLIEAGDDTEPDG